MTISNKRYLSSQCHEKTEEVKRQMIDDLCYFITFSSDNKVEDAFHSWAKITDPCSKEVHIFRERLLFNNFSVLEAFLIHARGHKQLSSEQKKITTVVLSRFSEENGLDFTEILSSLTRDLPVE